MSQNELSRDSPSSSGATTEESPPKYVPQFSAATKMILERIQSGNSTSFPHMSIDSSTPPGYEDMRRSVLQSMKTSINMEIPTTPSGGRKSSTKAVTSAVGNGARTPAQRSTTSGFSANGSKGKTTTKPKPRAGAKRKRANNESPDESEEESDDSLSNLRDSDSDASEEITELPPKTTQSGRPIVKPNQFIPATYESTSKRRAPSRKVREQALCKRCGRGHSPVNNLIVFCDGCNLPWHQKCHDPVISDAAVQDASAPWFCADCSRKKGIKSRYEPTESASKGVSWAEKTTDEKRAYLSSLPHHQLISLLLQATTLHPDLPIFPAAPVPVPMSNSARVLPQQPFPPSSTSTSGLFSRSEANPSAPMNFIRKIQSVAPLPQPSAYGSPAPPALPSENREESRESTPASPPYPKPSNGLMAKLAPDEEDLDWLVDGADFEAFSHVVYEAGEPSLGVEVSDVSMINGNVGTGGSGIGV